MSTVNVDNSTWQTNSNKNDKIRVVNDKIRVVFLQAFVNDSRMPNSAVSQKIKRKSPATPTAGGAVSSAPALKLPDVAVCRAVKSFAHYFDCLVVRPDNCTYTLNFGCFYTCINPERAAIAARTQAAQR